MTRLEIIELPGNNVAENLAREEEQFSLLRSDPAPLCMFYVNSPCIVLGRFNESSQWVDEDACRADNIPVVRRFTGGGTVYHDLNNLNFSMFAPRRMLESDSSVGLTSGPRQYIDFFRSVLISALEHTGDGFTPTGKSDVSLNGRKISGNAQRISREMVLHHGTVMLECPLAAIERYLPLPPDRPEVSHSDFVTGLKEQGRHCTHDQLKQWISSAYADALGLELDGTA